MSRRLLEQLSREIGRDARDEANARHPELRTCSDGHVEQLIDAIEYVMDYQSWPRTVENAERSYRILEANGELGRIAELHAPSPAPEGFTPRPNEEDWLRTGPLQEVAEYLKAKYEGKP